MVYVEECVFVYLQHGRKKKFHKYADAHGVAHAYCSYSFVKLISCGCFRERLNQTEGVSFLGCFIVL